MSSFKLKMSGILFMIIDHIGYFFPTIPYALYFRIIGRLAIPIFFYMLVEGFIHTSNRTAYKNRLWKFAFIMFIINIILILGTKILNIKVVFNYKLIVPDIFLSMVLCLYLLEYIELIFKKKQYTIYNFMFIIIFSIAISYTEVSIYGVAMMFIFYLLRDYREIKFTVFAIVSIIACVLKMNIVQVAMILSIVPLYFYNGAIGYKSKKSKMFFYYFYPIHLVFLYIVSVCIYL